MVSDSELCQGWEGGWFKKVTFAWLYETLNGGKRIYFSKKKLSDISRIISVPSAEDRRKSVSYGRYLLVHLVRI